MINFFWRIVAKLLARPTIADWIIARAKLTPYQHIMSADGQTMYMGRWCTTLALSRNVIILPVKHNPIQRTRPL